jgi:hypothetical protein
VPWHDINLHSGVKMGLYDNSFYGTRNDHRGERIQGASEMFPTPINHFISMASMIDVSFGGSGGKGGIMGLGEGSVKRFLAGWIWTEEGSFPSWTSK